MGTKQNPGAYDCYANALADEPMFVLLARDPQAPDLVRLWAEDRARRVIAGQCPVTDVELASEAHVTAADMEAWRGANDGRWRTEQPPVPPDVNADLLAALKDCSAYLGEPVTPVLLAPERNTLIRNVRAAIARAEGREPGEAA